MVTVLGEVDEGWIRVQCGLFTCSFLFRKRKKKQKQKGWGCIFCPKARTNRTLQIIKMVYKRSKAPDKQKQLQVHWTGHHTPQTKNHSKKQCEDMVMTLWDWKVGQVQLNSDNK